MHRDLGAVLRLAKKHDVKLRMHELINYAMQIADGCKYLASVRWMNGWTVTDGCSCGSCTEIWRCATCW